MADQTQVENPGASIMPRESRQHMYDTAKEDAVITGVVALVAGGIARFTLKSSRPVVKSTAGVFVLLAAFAGAVCVYRTVQAVKYSGKK